jgi:hypothetical protein
MQKKLLRDSQTTGLDRWRRQDGSLSRHAVRRVLGCCCQASSPPIKSVVGAIKTDHREPTPRSMRFGLLRPRCLSVPWPRAVASICSLRHFPALSCGVLTVAPCACCVNLYVCMYNVTYGILRVFPYFYHCITLLVFSCLLCFCFLIKFKIPRYLAACTLQLHCDSFPRHRRAGVTSRSWSGSDGHGHG